MLPNFEINQFRTFSHLAVGDFGAVNLIVGRNNVGKTMLLEGIRLYALGGDPLALRGLLIERDEVVTEAILQEGEEAIHLRIEALFHRNDIGRENGREITLGPIGAPERKLRLALRYLRRTRREPGGLHYEIARGNQANDPHVVPGLAVIQGEREILIPFYYFGEMGRRLSRTRGSHPTAWPAFVPARGVNDRALARWWDSVALKESEERVKECLRIIAPVERINLVEHPVPSARSDRIVMVRMTGEREPVPLKSLGDGMHRMFQISLALECSRLSPVQGELFPSDEAPYATFRENMGGDVILLIDEIENGIHYTAQADLWRFIFRVAQIHGVQVFATSHSRDAVISLAEAVREHPSADARVIRLERTPEAIRAVTLDQRELAIAARNGIEVR